MGRDIEVFERFRESDLPPEGQSAEVYLRYLEPLCGESGRWDRGKGWISWLQGRALNRLTESIKRKACDRGAYGRVLRQLSMKPTTAWYCRRIAAKCTAEEARTLGYLDLLRRIGAIQKARKKPVRKKRKKRFLQAIEAFHKYIEGIELSRECAHFAPPHRASADGHLKAIARAAGKVAGELEKGAQGVHLRVVDDKVTKEAV